MPKTTAASSSDCWAHTASSWQHLHHTYPVCSSLSPDSFTAYSQAGPMHCRADRAVLAKLELLLLSLLAGEEG